MIYIPHGWLIAAFAAAMLWKASQYRRNKDVALLAVVGAFFFLASGYAFGEYVQDRSDPWLLTAMGYEFVGTVLLIGSKVCVVAFFVLAARHTAQTRRILLALGIPLVASIVVLAVCAVVAGPDAKPYGFADPAVVGFNLGEKVITVPTGMLIVFYCFAYLRLLSGTPAHGIMLAAIGAVLMLAATVTFTVQLGYYAVSARPPRALVVLGRWEVYLGQLIFLLGVSWYGLVMRIRAVVLGLGALRDVLLLWRLWRFAVGVITRFLPERRMPGFRVREPLAAIMERRQAMMVDIRDALMLLSPQIDPTSTATVSGYARELQRVAAANRERPVLYGEPRRAAVDQADTFDADRKLLVALAADLGENMVRVRRNWVRPTAKV
ncbi:hypothetical protein LTT66_36375 [Nocardia gipuzkoensis]|uniref:hypothetical protein n=1 Tax=Nocardia gipuzkoensis TaxID=2749991 RepID=UPI001E3DE8E9|nr:hypothetical protein [Nocardia gipuzkoensis]UGT68543.1 hypothetical protein LTT66_36375 [Nocardia gipuzkoensis]